MKRQIAAWALILGGVGFTIGINEAWGNIAGRTTVTNMSTLAQGAAKPWHWVAMGAAQVAAGVALLVGK